MLINFLNTDTEHQYITLNDWNSIGAAIGVKANKMAYALHNRDEMQKRIRLGERTVYKSAPPLRHIQSRLLILLNPLFDALPDNQCAIAYRKGLTASDCVKQAGHANILISFDIRKYYDHITLKHIEDALVLCGFPRLGARLIGRYGVVKRNGQQTLQQGSPMSPVLSNIVGHFVFDVPILRWLKDNYANLHTTYFRYSDNIALMLHDQPDADFVTNFKHCVEDVVSEHGFKTHKWHTVADNHPIMNQKFLGMVINAEARVELEKVDKLRAILFNCCRYGVIKVAEKFFTTNGVTQPHNFETASLSWSKFEQYIRGHINYIRKISTKQGLILDKLYHAAQYCAQLKERRGLPESVSWLEDKLPIKLFEALKKYRNVDESVDAYVQRLQSIGDNW